MKPEPPPRVSPLSKDERSLLDALARSEILTVTIPQHVLVALLDIVDQADVRAERLGAVLQTYAELDESQAATLGELCGARFDLVDAKSRVGVLEALLCDAKFDLCDVRLDLVDAKSRVGVLEGLLRELEALVRAHIPGAPEPLSPEVIEAFVENRRRIEECGVKLEPRERWEDLAFEGLGAPKLDRAREARATAGHDFADPPPDPKKLDR